MPSPIKGTKHTSFTLRASKDFPSRKFKVVFTDYCVSIIKTGAGNRLDRYILRWRPLIGQMLMFRGEGLEHKDDRTWRGFIIPFKAPYTALSGVEFIVEFCDKGVRIKNAHMPVSDLWIFWSWRTLLNVVIMGI